MAPRSSPDRFALRSQRVLTPAGLRPAAVVVEGERIAAVIAPGDLSQTIAVEDLGELVLFPGLVDSHVHLNEPGRREWEGFEMGTRAAAAGGVTTLIDMPLNCRPATTTRAAVLEKMAAAQGQLRVDCGLWGGLVPGNQDEIGPMLEAGVLGFKAFLIHSGLDDFPNVGLEDLRTAMPRIRDGGAPLLVHAELDCGGAPARDEAAVGSYARYLRSRPRAWENLAVERMIELARETRCPCHIVHLSSCESLPALSRARADDVPLTVETCPHYLTLAAEEVPDGNTRFKCAPPIREAENQEGLWRGLAEGVIDVVVTDHSPCAPALKHLEAGDFDRAWGGIASLQLGLPAVWTEARRRGYGLEALARWMCSAPARLAGLAGRKGTIAPGHDADLVAWDPEGRFRVEPEALRLRHPQASPYLGRELVGVVETTWLRGRAVHRRAVGVEDEPHGVLLRGRTCAPTSGLSGRDRSSSRRD
jgi:allantoinase